MTTVIDPENLPPKKPKRFGGGRTDSPITGKPDPELVLREKLAKRSKPVVTPLPNDPHYDEREEHPAYAQVSVTRGSVGGGGLELYGSDFKHRSVINVAIYPSKLHRQLNSDWPSAEGTPLLEFQMSEAQWASFVSSMGQGGGTQATLNFVKGEGRIPPIVRGTDRREQFTGELQEKFKTAKEALQKAKNEINASKLPQHKKRDLCFQLDVVASNTFGPSIKFVAEQFDEHVEKTVEKAKAELSIFINKNPEVAGVLTGGNDVLRLEEPKAKESFRDIADAKGVLCEPCRNDCPEECAQFTEDGVPCDNGEEEFLS